MKKNMDRSEFVKYLRKRGMTFAEFYALMGQYFNMTSSERFDLIKTTPMYKELKGDKQ